MSGITKGITYGAIVICILLILWRPVQAFLGPSEFNIHPHFIGTPNFDKPYVVVFVHGVFGSGNDTFVHGTSSFPNLLAEDSEFKQQTDVFSFEYYSPRFGDAQAVPELASSLRQFLEDKRVLKYKHIVFLSHSMGGLIVRELLEQAPIIADKTSMLYFYATPTNGVNISWWARLFSTNRQLVDMFPISGNSQLIQLNAAWMGNANLLRISTHCAYESSRVSGVVVVPMESAISLCVNHSNDSMPYNHIDIVKPPDREDQRYTRFASALREAEAVAETPPSIAKVDATSIITYPISKERPSAPPLAINNHEPTVKGSEEKLKPVLPIPLEKFVYEYTDLGHNCLGAFRQVQASHWREETISPPPCATGSGFDFQQEESDASWVMLYDQSRDVYIRLPALSNSYAQYKVHPDGSWMAIHFLRPASQADLATGK